ncbi:MAG TPA: hypothetical protein VF258_10085 [Luteolibacter sp.]
MRFERPSALFVILSAWTVGSLLGWVGAKEWKKGSDRAGCILNIRNVQQTIRGYQGVQNLGLGSPIQWDMIIGENGYMNVRPTCAGNTYTFTETVPDLGKLACTCSDPTHVPPDHKDW